MEDKKLEEELLKLDETCDFCQTHKRRTANPAVTALDCKDFNDLVAIDLKFFREDNGKQTIVMHVIDHLTRYSAAKIIRSKNGEEVVRALLTNWISIFGSPRSILTDNGLEFCNKEVNDLCEMLGITHRTTASYSPYSNGLVEKHNDLLGRILKKVKADLKVDTEIALCWALQAKNSLLNKAGFSPSQLAFGRTPVTVQQTEDPVMLERTSSELVAGILNSMRTAREAFHKINAKDKLKIATKCRVENSSCDHFVTGDRVYFKRSVDQQWVKGTVIGQIGSTVWIERGGQQVKAHFTKVSLRRNMAAKDPPSEGYQMEEKKQRRKWTNKDPPSGVQDDNNAGTRSAYLGTRSQYSPEVVPTEEWVWTDEENEEEDYGTPPVTPVKENGGEEETTDGRDEENVNKEDEENEENGLYNDMPGLESEQHEDEEKEEEGVPGDSEEVGPEDKTEKNGDACKSSDESTEEEDSTNTPVFTVSESAQDEDKDEEDKDPRRMEYVQFHVPVAVKKDKTGNMQLKDCNKISYEYMGEGEQAIVLGGAGKKTGKFANRYNLSLFSSAQLMRVLLDEVDNVEVLEKRELGIYFESDMDSQLVFNTKIPERDDPGIKSAKDKEIEQLKKFDVIEEIKDSGQQKISTTWVITEKTKGDSKVFKARLCCRGYEENLDSDLAVESPTTEKVSIRIFLAICAVKLWVVRSLDIKAAFLQAEEIGRDVFVQPPKEYRRDGTLWRLKRPLYGLNDASRKWYFTLKQYLESVGLKKSEYDKAMFYWIQDGKLQGMLNVHVDDIIYGGTCKFLDIMKKLGKQFELSKSTEGPLRYVGIDIGYQGEKGELTISQQSYRVEVPKLVQDQIADATDETLLIGDLLTAYQSAVGKLNWLACNTRPDLKHAVFKFSSATPPRVGDMRNVLKTLRKKNHGPSFIIYPKLDASELKVIVYTDASHGSLDDGMKSCQGYIVFLADSTRCAALDWGCKKIDKTCNSVLEAEGAALGWGLSHAEIIRDNVCSLLNRDTKHIPLIARVDCKTLFNTCYKASNISDPLLKREVGRINEKIVAGDVSSIEFRRTKFMLADILTKFTRADSVILKQVLTMGVFIEKKD